MQGAARPWSSMGARICRAALVAHAHNQCTRLRREKKGAQGTSLCFEQLQRAPGAAGVAGGVALAVRGGDRSAIGVHGHNRD